MGVTASAAARAAGRRPRLPAARWPPPPRRAGAPASRRRSPAASRSRSDPAAVDARPGHRHHHLADRLRLAACRPCGRPGPSPPAGSGSRRRTIDLPRLAARSCGSRRGTRRRGSPARPCGAGDHDGASRASSTGSESPAGLALATLPPSVARFWICQPPTCRGRLGQGREAGADQRRAPRSRVNVVVAPISSASGARGCRAARGSPAGRSPGPSGCSSSPAADHEVGAAGDRARRPGSRPGAGAPRRAQRSRRESSSRSPRSRPSATNARRMPS